jgi:hypothetical protein
MPRYFFHLYNDIYAQDEEGRELPDLEVAHANAVREARELMMETLSKGELDLSHRIEVTDETGAVLATITFGEAVLVKGQQSKSPDSMKSRGSL